MKKVLTTPVVQVRINYLKPLVHSLLFAVALVSAFLVRAQDPPQYGTPFAGVPDPRDVNMYQAHLRIFSPGSNFESIDSRLDQIQALGINVLYLMPIFPHGEDVQSSESPYCIRDFKAIDPEYGDLSSLRQLVDAAHARGMAVILDIAINGTSWDNVWTTTNPEYFTGNQLGPFSDIAELDLNSPATRAGIIDAMRYWIFAANIDGYRCDFANNPPLDFWTEVINNLRGITSHDLLMLAEGDRLENFQAGFDMNFGDKWFYDALEDVSKLNASVSSRLDAVNSVEYTYANSVQQVIRYTGNHDTYTNGFNGVDGGARPFLMFNNHDGVVANFLVSAYMKGVPFLMSGQEVDYDVFTPWPWTSPTIDINWAQNPSATQDFSDILNFRKNSLAIRRGTLTNYSSNDVCAFTKISGNEEVVVIVNMRNSSVNYIIPAALAGTYTDAYSGTSVNLTSGANQSLSAYEYLVLTNSSGCAATPIEPYVSVNGGALQQVTSVTVEEGDNVILDPLPTGGTWSWTGPNGFSSASRQQTFTDIVTGETGVYTANYINACGTQSTQDFTIDVNPPSNVPAPWSTSDIGAVGIAGSANFSSGTFTVNASGADIWENADEFRYVYQQITGDMTVIARVQSLTNTNGWAKAGVMVRNDLGASSAHAMTAVTAANGLAFQRRTTNGNLSDHTAGPSGGTPYWIRLARVGDNFVSSVSSDGTNWAEVGSALITMGSTAYVGLAVTSHDNGLITTAAFSDVSLTTGVINQPPLANAGTDQTLPSGTTTASLNGSGSDPDGNTLSYSWSQTSGLPVTINNSNSAGASVNGLSNGNSYTFQLMVSDGLGGIDTDDIVIAVDSAPGGQNPYAGTPVTIPGIIEFENYDTGGQSVAYNDNDVINSGGQFRVSEGVDLEVCLEGGFNLGWTNAGEWVEYTVDVVSAGDYDIAIRAASGGSGGNFRIEFDGVDKTGAISVSNTGGWQSWQTVSVTDVSLDAGEQVMRVYMNTDGINLNNLTFTASTTGGGAVYRIENRWTGDVIYDNGAQASYGIISASDPVSHWELESVDGHTVIKNVNTGDYLNIESQQAYVESTAVPTSYYSAQWTLESHDGHTRIRNRWQSSEYVHNENLLGYAQHASIFIGSHSSHWTLVPVGSGARVASHETVPGMDEHELNAYPNPFIEILNIKVDGLNAGAYEVTVWDLSGSLVLKSSFNVGAQNRSVKSLKVNHLTKGIYHLRIRGSGFEKSMKVLKR